MIPLSDDTQLSLVLSGTVDSPRFKNAVIYILLPFSIEISLVIWAPLYKSARLFTGLSTLTRQEYVLTTPLISWDAINVVYPVLPCDNAVTVTVSPSSSTLKDATAGSAIDQCTGVVVLVTVAVTFWESPMLREISDVEREIPSMTLTVTVLVSPRHVTEISAVPVPTALNIPVVWS